MKVAYYFGRLNRGGAETLVADLLMCHENIPFQPVCIYRDEGTLSEMFRQSGAPMLKLRRRKELVGLCSSIKETYQERANRYTSRPNITQRHYSHHLHCFH